MLKFKIFNSFNSECEALWKKASKTSVYNFFQSYDYLKQLTYVENADIVKIVFIFYENEVVAIYPLTIKKYFCFKVLQWLGTGKSDYCNPIISDNFYEILNKNKFLHLWELIIKDLGKFDLIFFNNQPGKIQQLDNPFTEFFNTINFSNIYQIRLPSSYEHYKKNIKDKNTKYFYEIHRTSLKLIKLEKEFNVNFIVKDIDEKNLEFKNTIKNKIEQLKLKNYKHSLDKNFITIYENLIKKNNSHFYIFSLEINKKITSSCFGIIYKGIFYYFIPTLVSDDYNNFKPGKILILKIIKWCISKELQLFDFGLGSERYKKYFSDISIPIHRYILHNNFKGFIFSIFLRFFLKN